MKKEEEINLEVLNFRMLLRQEDAFRLMRERVLMLSKMDWSRAEVIFVLEEVRKNQTEKDEDQVLDLLDRVGGFCNPSQRIHFKE